MCLNKSEKIISIVTHCDTIPQRRIFGNYLRPFFFFRLIAFSSKIINWKIYDSFHRKRKDRKLEFR